MPEISRFLGIVIAMYYRDHEPAHFHANYGDYAITVDIQTGLVHGEFPKRAMRHVLECVKSIGMSCLRIGSWRESAGR